MIILGISCLYHDSAAAICVNGNVVAAVQEERFTRKKHDNSIPINAIHFCLEQVKVKSSDVDAVVYYDNPLLTLDRFLHNLSVLSEEERLNMLKKEAEDVFGQRIWIHKRLRNAIGQLGKNDKLSVCEHHISHAASAFYPSPFQEAAILTMDGVGEWATTTIGIGKDNKVSLLRQIKYPHSLGLLYSAFTYFCGFKVNSGDYKFMGLAPYGEPVYYQLIKEHLIHIKADGSYQLNLEYFDFYKGTVMTNRRFEELFEGPRREPESEITQREMNIAASAQKVTEEVIILLAKEAKKITNMDNLCLAGGVALNCVANGKLQKADLFKNIWIQPAAGDAGGALGAALYAGYHSMGQARIAGANAQKGSYLGVAYSNEEVESFLRGHGYHYRIMEEKQALYQQIAEYLDGGKVIGLFQGKMEFGPRALGGRSIIADPRKTDMQSKLNLKIKYRESFRPFAPSVLKEHCEDYFELNCESPYMLLVAEVIPDRRKEFNKNNFLTDSGYNMLPVVNAERSDIPAVTHVDYSARIQTVEEDTNPYYYGVINAFYNKTGCAVVVNTSFNVRGEPIVCSLEDAYQCFMRTEMDVLVLENCILLKEEQDEVEDTDNWREKYELD